MTEIAQYGSAIATSFGQRSIHGQSGRIRSRSGEGVAVLRLDEYSLQGITALSVAAGVEHSYAGFRRERGAPRVTLYLAPEAYSTGSGPSARPRISDAFETSGRRA